MIPEADLAAQMACAVSFTLHNGRWTTAKKTANGALRDAAHRLHQGVLYYQSIMQVSQYTSKCNFVHARKKRTAFLVPVFMKSIMC